MNLTKSPFPSTEDIIAFVKEQENEKVDHHKIIDYFLKKGFERIKTQTIIVLCFNKNLLKLSDDLMVQAQ